MANVYKPRHEDRLPSDDTPYYDWEVDEDEDTRLRIGRLEYDLDQANEYIESLEESLADSKSKWFDSYQAFTSTTAIYPDSTTLEALSYCVLGLTNEAGEVAGKLKKILRDQDGVITIGNRDDVLSEVGDVLYYAARIAQHLAIPLSLVVQANVNKLTDRAERGVLGGSGDRR